MSGNSNNVPALARPDFDPKEFEHRRARLSEMMRRENFDGLLVNSEANHRYFTGHWTGRWSSRTRPVFLIVSQHGAATILCSVLEQGMAHMSAAGCTVKTYGGSGYSLDPALAVLADELRALGLERSRVAAELGTYHRPQIPPSAFENLRALLPEMRLVDGSDMLWRIRAQKSSAEVEHLKRAINITQQMFDRVPEWLAIGQSERAVFHQVSTDLLSFGGEQVGYINVVHDITQTFSGGFTDRELALDKVVYIDAGCIVAGYWSDFARVFALGTPVHTAEDAYKKLWDVTSEGIEAVKPGQTIRELYSVIRHGIERAIGELPMLGRVGHSTGLEMPEPPSICLEEEWVIQPGMVLNIEPSLNVPGGGTLIAEEMVVVTENGAELLTHRAPASIPRV